MAPVASPLPLYHLLDARSERESLCGPIAASVNIPASQIPARSHELPRARETIRIAGTGPEAHIAQQLLSTLGRACTLTSDWTRASSIVPPGRLWRPNSFLETMLERLGPAARAFDLGCGTGRDAVFLACHGWSVTAADHDGSALERGAIMAAGYKSIAEPVKWLHTDLERDPLLDGPFELVTCFRFMSREVICQIPRMLAPGGHALIEAFTPENRLKHNRPKSERRVVNLHELIEMLHPLRVELADAGWNDDVHTARIWVINNVPEPR